MKVLFLTNSKLQHYRIPIFKLVNDAPNIELTLAHCGKQVVQNEIPELLLNKKRIGSYYYISSFNEIIKDYDTILCMFYLNNISFDRVVLHKKNKKVILWGIGVPASYDRAYGDAGKMRYRLLRSFYKKSDAQLFYSDAPKKLFKEKGLPLDENEVFIANNTVEVIKQDVDEGQKDSLLFIGTLYLEKGLQVLLDSYKEACGIDKEMIPLNIVGGGKQFEVIQNWVVSNHLENKINLFGPVYDLNKKAEIFKKAIACVSPQQAGLSVLESMGYGVPFITSENAITGGEAFNITDGENGLRMKDVSQLKDVLLDINNNKEKYFVMGRKAYDYYWNNRTPQIMANGIISAINYVNR